MKTKLLTIVFLSLMSLLCLSGCLSIKDDPDMNRELIGVDLTVGKMAIKIQDAVTGKPMSGVYIYRMIGRLSDTFMDPSMYKLPELPLDYAVSDDEGMVIFPEKTVAKRKKWDCIYWADFQMNFSFFKDIDPNDTEAYRSACNEALDKNDGILSKNRKNDAFKFSLYKTSSVRKEEYKVRMSIRPRVEYAWSIGKYDFTEPYKMIVIKLGNDSLNKEGIKTEVTFEDQPTK